MGQDWRWKVVVVPGIGGRFRCLLGVVEELKSPCGGRGFWGWAGGKVVLISPCAFNFQRGFHDSAAHVEQ